MTKPTRLGLTMGDPAGVGPEIIVKLFDKHRPTDCIVYGDPSWLARTADSLGISIPIHTLFRPDSDILSGHLPVMTACEEVPVGLELGRVQAMAGKIAYQCVDKAISDSLDRGLSGLVTAPLNKQAIHQAGIDFPGHTEILAHRCGDIPVAMVLANDVLRVALVTIHMPLSEVAPTISQALELQTIALANTVCRALGIAEPRIAVAGLNPHAGEGGKFGREEIETIEPAIKQACQTGLNVSGPWPGDTVFARARTGEFDIVVAQYHDQGLIPVKYLGLDQGVNITVGLPFVRTSVDHGTAFDIAGKGVASEASLTQAVYLARILAAHQADQ